MTIPPVYVARTTMATSPKRHTPPLRFEGDPFAPKNNASIPRDLLNIAFFGSLATLISWPVIGPILKSLWH